MPLNARNMPRSGGIEPVEEGTYPGRVVQIIDLGRQPREYQGQSKEPWQAVWMTYELVDEFLKKEDGSDDVTKPRWVSEQFYLYNLDNDKAKSTERFNAIDPNGEADGDLTLLLNFPANIAVVLNKKGERVYNKVGNVTPMRAKDREKCPELVNPTLLFMLDDPDMEAWERLPDFLKDIIKKNVDYQGSLLEARLEGHAPEEADSDDVPF